MTAENSMRVPASWPTHRCESSDAPRRAAWRPTLAARRRSSSVIAATITCMTAAVLLEGAASTDPTSRRCLPRRRRDRLRRRLRRRHRRSAARRRSRSRHHRPALVRAAAGALARGRLGSPRGREALRLRAPGRAGPSAAAARHPGPDRRCDAARAGARLPPSLADAVRSGEHQHCSKFDERAFEDKHQATAARGAATERDQRREQARRSWPRRNGASWLRRSGCSSKSKSANALLRALARRAQPARSCCSSQPWVSLFDYLTVDTRVANRDDAARQPVGARESAVERGGRPGRHRRKSEQALKRKFDPSWRTEHADADQQCGVGIGARRGVRHGARGRRPRTPRTLRSDGARSNAREAVGRLRRAAQRRRRRGAILAQFAPLVRRGINCAGLTIGQTGSMPLAVRAGPARRRARAKARRASRAS